MPKYKIADVVFDITPIYTYSAKVCEKYLYTGSEVPSYKIVMDSSDIEKERINGAEFADYYLESLAIYRKICDVLIDKHNAILFHSSAISVDGEGYLFTAPSGTGKSTHTRLWREMLGDRAVMINDDKPIIRYVDDNFYVYGTPWNGKHGLDTNTRVKIKAICELKRGEKNVIKEISPKDILVTILNQTVRFEDRTKMANLLSLIDKLLKSVKLYRLWCDVSAEAAEVSYGAMSNVKGEFYEN